MALDGRAILLNCAVMFGIVLLPFATEAWASSTCRCRSRCTPWSSPATYLMQHVVEFDADRRGSARHPDDAARTRLGDRSTFCRCRWSSSARSRSPTWSRRAGRNACWILLARRSTRCSDLAAEEDRSGRRTGRHPSATEPIHRATQHRERTPRMTVTRVAVATPLPHRAAAPDHRRRPRRRTARRRRPAAADAVSRRPQRRPGLPANSAQQQALSRTCWPGPTFCTASRTSTRRRWPPRSAPTRTCAGCRRWPPAAAGRSRPPA